MVRLSGAPPWRLPSQTPLNAPHSSWGVLQTHHYQNKIIFIYITMSYSKAIFSAAKMLNNLANLPTQNVCAMVKANAYGCGLERVCKTLCGKVSFFGTATLEEALRVRQICPNANVLIVGMCQNFLLAAKNNISVTIDNLSQLEFIAKQNISIKIHLKINSGMNRFGIKNKKILKKVLKIIKKSQKIIFEGIFTHFSDTNNKKLVNAQLVFFQDFIKNIAQNFDPIIHVGGGGVCDALSAAKLNNLMVRVGLKLYSGVLQIQSQIIKITVLKKGETLGYSAGFIAPQKTRVAIVPLGYADGINRKLSCGGTVQILGQNCKIIGNICMDIFFVDVTNSNCQEGQIVLVFFDAENWAKICQTISYEILTSLNFERMQVVCLTNNA